MLDQVMRTWMVRWTIAAAAGSLTALAVTWGGDWIGMWLESVFATTLRAWEFAALQVAMVNTPAGGVAALLGALSKRWGRGLGIGAAPHAAIFLIFVGSSDSFRVAPLSVKGWVLAVGILAGATAGGIGGWLGQTPPNKGPETPPSVGAEPGDPTE